MLNKNACFPALNSRAPPNTPTVGWTDTQTLVLADFRGRGFLGQGWGPRTDKHTCIHKGNIDRNSPTSVQTHKREDTRTAALLCPAGNHIADRVSICSGPLRSKLLTFTPLLPLACSCPAVCTGATTNSINCRHSSMWLTVWCATRVSRYVHRNALCTSPSRQGTPLEVPLVSSRGDLNLSPTLHLHFSDRELHSTLRLHLYLPEGINFSPTLHLHFSGRELHSTFETALASS